MISFGSLEQLEDVGGLGIEVRVGDEVGVGVVCCSQLRRCGCSLASPI